MDYTLPALWKGSCGLEPAPRRGDPHPMPYTIYNIKVLKNIKGELSTEESITVAKNTADLRKTRKVIQLTEGDALLEVGKGLYIFNMYVTDDVCVYHRRSRL